MIFHITSYYQLDCIGIIASHMGFSINQKACNDALIIFLKHVDH